MTDSTPPNWPIYNVTLSENEIQNIVDRVYPKARLVSARNLPKGKSFNNRIYFLSIQHEQDDSREQEIVLKVIGRFFDARKVQNEVGSLLLLRRFCPNVPVPEVLAWSDDGLQITAIQNGVYAVLSDPIIDPEPPTTKPHPWIMMSKRPGRILTEDDMLGEHREAIADQLADIIKLWRESIPSREEVGNIKLQSADFTSSHALHGLDTIVTHPLLTDSRPDLPIVTLQQYYNHLLTDQIHKANTNEVFTGLRPLVTGDLQTFQTETFPRLLDFEFAGFFPPEEEYLTCLGRQSDDWPPDFISLVLRKLEDKGVAVPDRQSDLGGFDGLLKVIELIEYIAPWWLQDGHITGKELEIELEKASTVVKRNMDDLAKSIGEK